VLVSNDPAALASHIAGKSVLLEISSEFEMLRLVDDVSEQFGQMAGLDEDSVHWLGVAVREAVVNGIKHGNAGDKRKRVRVEYTVVNGDPRPRVVVRVRDEGPGFDVAELADPLAPENVSGTSGRGLFLIRTFMDDVQVRPAADGGTEVVMAKAINPTLPVD
jgi:serine/threonine-protein kinase RsbW